MIIIRQSKAEIAETILKRLQNAIALSEWRSAVSDILAFTCNSHQSSLTLRVRTFRLAAPELSLELGAQATPLSRAASRSRLAAPCKRPEGLLAKLHCTLEGPAKLPQSCDASPVYSAATAAFDRGSKEREVC